ncbi:MAG: hypothetical protein Q4F79_13210 [Eubacteriales bacterium]|nr:hypothetical protein [Eubacteriales bacterium]
MTITIYAAINEREEVNGFIKAMEEARNLPKNLSVHFMDIEEKAPKTE